MPRRDTSLVDYVEYWVVVVDHDIRGLPLFLGPYANPVDTPEKAIRFHKDDREGAEKTAKVCGDPARVARMEVTWRVIE